MALNQDYPIYNGISPSWADMTFRITPDGAPLIRMADIAEIKTSWSVEVGEHEGTSGGRVMKRTTGKAKHEASIVLYYDGAVQLYETLVDLAPTRGDEKAISLVHFGGDLAFTPQGSTRVFRSQIFGARIIGDELAAAQGTDAQKVSINLSVSQVARIVKGFKVVPL